MGQTKRNHTGALYYRLRFSLIHSFKINFEMGEVGHRIKTAGEVNGLAWHPSKLLLASCGDDEDKPTVGWVSFFVPPL